jgi:phosphoglycolate phosphatase-like HAD superfamily hydrolase
MELIDLAHRTPEKDFLIAIDSDGCAFDSMELKHKECFIPNIIQHWRLQPIARYARQASEFVNLYSRWRGVNRFPALLKTFELLREWDAVQQLHFELPDLGAIEAWTAQESKLSNVTLAAYCEKHDDPILHQALAWSLEANERVDRLVRAEAPPFPRVVDALQAAGDRAEIMVCSATPHDTLVKEWEAHGMMEHIFAVCGQEQGSKKEILRAMKDHYPANHILMVGDSPNDMKAAHANDALFYPIVARDEIASWQHFYGTGLETFFSGAYSGDYEAGLIRTFLDRLPETPPWESGVESNV